MDPVPAKAPASRTRAALELAITGAALLLACDLIRRMILRALFPLDLWIWSESPFLTNLLKLQAGVPLWGPPSDTNSFVYSPGLEYACRFLLSPFRLQFDITYLRAVAIALSVLTSLVANTMAFAAARSSPLDPWLLRRLAPDRAKLYRRPGAPRRFVRTVVNDSRRSFLSRHPPR
jgi:hypothetical protein